MQYASIYIRGTRESYTWHTEDEVCLGARVEVLFRNRKRLGVVHAIFSTKPEFRTQPIVRVVDEHFLPPQMIELAYFIATSTCSTVQKVLSLMIPDAFLTREHPERRRAFLRITDQDPKLYRTEVQQEIAKFLRTEGETDVALVRKKFTSAAVQQLFKKGAVELVSAGLIPALDGRETLKRVNHTLTTAQSEVLDSLMNDSRPSLLWGVTGSGKTEVYKHAAQHIFSADSEGQVLLLVPEIALTTQLIGEMKAMFGSGVAVWHSHLSPAQKVQEFARIASGEARILIAARSGILVPFANLKLIILDEEHEWTYKNESAPRFLSHDVAEKLGELWGAKVIFGTATPRTESVHRVNRGEWQRLDLPDRVTDVALPRIEFVDMRGEQKKGNYSPLSERLIEDLKSVLSRGKQAVLFLNRRGYSGVTLCRKCGQSFECPHCHHPMKMHRRGTNQKFICHICGHMEKFPLRCPACGEEDFSFRGWGTQMVETALGEHFPSARIVRADADSMTGKYDFERMMHDFSDQKADILLGTQMVAKGLDFEHVEFVGVILADVGLALPDPRSGERVFQLLTQVSGRAGRRKRRGEILIQTFAPENPLFNYLKEHDTEGFLNEQLREREKFHMPPYVTYAKLTLSDTDKGKTFRQAQELFERLKNSFHGECFLAPAFFPYTHGKYHFHIFLSAESREELLEFFSRSDIPPEVRIDIAPSSFL